MKEFLWSFYVGTTLFSGLSTVSPASAQIAAAPTPAGSAPASCPTFPQAQSYDVIVFGDEVPGVMTAIKVKQELWNVMGRVPPERRPSARVALITEGNADEGLGGHLVRGGLAYLDRNQVPAELRSQYGLFGKPSRLYRDFLGLGRVGTIALDRTTLSDNFDQTLDRLGIEVIDNIELEMVQTAGTSICAMTASGQTYSAQQFVDASQSGELAAVSGVEMMQGLEALGLPDSSLSMGLIMDFHDVTIDQFRTMEAELTHRYFDPSDRAAQEWLNVASGNDPAQRQALLQNLIDEDRNPKLLYQGTTDSADVRSLALSILVHGWMGKAYDLKSAGFLFDRANIAIFPDRLSFNALLFYADADTAQRLSQSGAKPTAEMLAIANEIKTLFETIGVPRVEVMEELYVRNAGQIANPIDELSATLMAAGGISPREALGTFGYHLDDRGGIEGLEEQVNESVLRLFDFEHMPVFNYGFRHTLPQETENLAVLGPASGFGGLGMTAGRIVEFNVAVGEGLAIAIAEAIAEDTSLHTITNVDVRESLDYTPTVYGHRTNSFRGISALEQHFRAIDYEQRYLSQAQEFIEQRNYPEAVRTITRALTLVPHSAQAYYLRGRIQILYGNRAQAQSDFERAITLYQGQGDFISASAARGTLESLLN